MKQLQALSLALLLIAPPAACGDHVGAMIRCTSKEEQHIDLLYETYVAILDNRSLSKGATLHLPTKADSPKGDYVIFSWAYYVTPNNLRGFEISVPKQHLARKGRQYVASVDLTVDRAYFKQGQHIIVLKASPNHGVKRTPTAGAP